MMLREEVLDLGSNHSVDIFPVLVNVCVALYALHGIVVCDNLDSYIMTYV